LALKGVGFFLGGGGVSSSSRCIFKHSCTILQRAETISSFLGAAFAAASSPPIVLM
jgi:hypothetical protein